MASCASTSRKSAHLQDKLAPKNWGMTKTEEKARQNETTGNKSKGF